MNSEIDAVLSCASDSFKNLSPQDYVNALEEVIVELEARLQAAKEEIGD